MPEMEWMRKQAVIERQFAADRAAAVVDAHNLALELTGLQPDVVLDPAVAGIVLRQGETVRRLVNAWLRQRSPEGWTEPNWSQVFVTDQRLLVRLGSGELASLWWGALVGFEAELSSDHVVLDLVTGSRVCSRGHRRRDRRPQHFWGDVEEGGGALEA